MANNTPDIYRFNNNNRDTPIIHHFAITPAVADLENITRCLWVGVLGDVAVETEDGIAVTYVGVQGLLPVRAARVLAAGTTATSIVGGY